jgi:protein arginine kinase activator
MNVYCQKCQKEAASVHVTDIDDGGTKSELHLCEECAKTQNVPQAPVSSVLSLFKELMEKTNTVSRTRDRVCPQCGLSFGEFKSKGRFGCAHDYEVFLSRVVPLLERIHGASEHLGESDAAHATKSAGDAAATELKRLRRDLQRVVKSEEYEEAARIRDRIQHLEKEIETGGGVDG